MNEFEKGNNEQSIPIPQEIRDEFDSSQKEWLPIMQQYFPDLEEYFLSPENFDTILKFFPAGELDKDQYKWELGNISRILGKILIPDSVRPTLENARRLAQELTIDDNTNIELFDVCSGAGIASMMNWVEIKKVHPDKNCTIFAVDKALSSIRIAEKCLSLKNIPVKRVALEEIDKVSGFDGIVLIESDVTDSADEFQASGKTFHAIYSDHGIGYFSHNSHDQIVETTTQSLLKDKGIFQVCSLESNVSVSLDYPKMIMEILFNKNLLSTIPDEENPYVLTEEDGKAIVSAMNTEDSAALYSLLQKFFHHLQWGDFGQYILAIIRVAKATKTHACDVRSSIEHTQKVLKVFNNDSDIVPPFGDQEYSIARTVWYYNNS
ncbi:hypothetical protein K8R20_01175 [bacterium]|nr:hypothetical protein [bacterium]